RHGAPRLFQQQLDAALVAIAEYPEIGHRLTLRRYPNARSYMLQRSGYVVLYNVDPTAAVVTVVRVRHGETSAAEVPIAQDRRCCCDVDDGQAAESTRILPRPSIVLTFIIINEIASSSRNLELPASTVRRSGPWAIHGEQRVTGRHRHHRHDCRCRCS